MAIVEPDSLSNKAVFVPGQNSLPGMSAQELLDAAITCEYLAISGNLQNPQAAARRAEHLFEQAGFREAYEQGVGESSP